MRRSLGEDVHRKLSQALRESIDYAYAHVDEAIDYAMRYGQPSIASALRLMSVARMLTGRRASSRRRASTRSGGSAWIWTRTCKLSPGSWVFPWVRVWARCWDGERGCL